MEGGEGLIFLSSGFNSTLSEYHNTKLYKKGFFSSSDACFTSTISDGKVGV